MDPTDQQPQLNLNVQALVESPMSSSSILAALGDQMNLRLDDSGMPTTRSSTPKLKSGDGSRCSSPSMLAAAQNYPVSVRQQMARIKQMEQPSPSGSTDGELTAPATPSTGGKRKVPKVHKRNGRGETPLHVAAKKGDIALCRQLIAEGAEVNQDDNAGWTPLHEACSNNRYEVVLFLIRHGANVNSRSAYGDLPLHDAVSCGFTRLVWTLLHYGSDKDDRCLESARGSTIRRLLTEPLPEECPPSESEGEDDGSDDERNKRETSATSQAGSCSTPTLFGPNATLLAANSPLAAGAMPTTAASPYPLSIDTEETDKRREAESRSVPATTPISVIVGEEREEGEVADDDGEKEERRTDKMNVRHDEATGAHLLTIAEDYEIRTGETTAYRVARSESREEGEIDDDTDGAEKEEMPQRHLEVNVVPPTPMEEKSMEMDEERSASLSPAGMQIVEEDDEDSRKEEGSERLVIDEVEEDRPSSAQSIALGEDARSKKVKSLAKAQRKRGGSTTPSDRLKSRMSAGPSRVRSALNDESGRSARSAEPEGGQADDPFEFHSSPESSGEEEKTRPQSRSLQRAGERELSVPPSVKRQRLDHTVSPSPARDYEGDEAVGDDDEDTRLSSASGISRKVPPLRLVLPKTSEEPEPASTSSSTDDTVTPSTSGTTISTVRKPGRGRPGRKGQDDEDGAQRMTRSKVRQSGRGLDDSEGGQRRRGRRPAHHVEMAGMMEETREMTEMEDCSESGVSSVTQSFDPTAFDPAAAAAAVALAAAQQQPAEAAVLSAGIAAGLFPGAGLASVNPVEGLMMVNSMQGRIDFGKMLDAHCAALLAVQHMHQPWEPTPEDKGEFIMWNKEYQGTLLRPQEVQHQGSPENVPELMRDVWMRQEEERHRVERELLQERTRLRMHIEQEVVRWERRRRAQGDRVTAISYLNASEACNPLILTEAPRTHPSSLLTREQMIVKMEKKISDLANRHKQRIDSIFAQQKSLYRSEATQRRAKRGMKEVLEQFPRMVLERVALPPIEGSMLEPQLGLVDMMQIAAQ